MKRSLIFVLLFALTIKIYSQHVNSCWHRIEREIHDKPDKKDFVLVNGNKRFNRALYGGNTAFRVEAGDLPEFAIANDVVIGLMAVTLVQ